MKRFILFAFVLVLDCHGVNTGSTVYCPYKQYRSNGKCCWWWYYYNMKAQTCKPCGCSSYGAKGGSKGRCDGKGNCYCYDDFKGSECQSCKPGLILSNNHCCLKDHYYATWITPNHCRPCRCKAPGSKGGVEGGCDSYGWCYCKPYYGGSACQECEKGSQWSNGHCCPSDHYYATWITPNHCRPCRCDEYGAKGGKKGGCDSYGWCYCKADRKGSACQECVKGLPSNGHCCPSDSYYNDSFGECRTCKCTAPGSKGGTKGGCDWAGNCYCYPGYSGMECQNRNSG